MQIKTLLNACHKFKSFVYQEVHWELINGVRSLVARLVPRKNSRARCSQCGRCAGIYDHSPKERDFRFVPLWGYPVVLLTETFSLSLQ